MTTQELTREIGEIKPLLSRVEEKVSNCCERLETVEAEQKEQRRLLVAVERIANGMDNLREKVSGLDDKVDKVGCRVEAIEQKPAKRWEALVSQIIGLAVAAGFGYLLSVILQ